MNNPLFNLDRGETAIRQYGDNPEQIHRRTGIPQDIRHIWTILYTTLNEDERISLGEFYITGRFTNFTQIEILQGVSEYCKNKTYKIQGHIRKNIDDRINHINLLIFAFNFFLLNLKEKISVAEKDIDGIDATTEAVEAIIHSNEGQYSAYRSQILGAITELDNFVGDPLMVTKSVRTAVDGVLSSS